MSMNTNHRRSRPVLAALGLAAAAAAIVVASAVARGAAPPTVTSNPTIEGPTQAPFVGDTLTGTTGRWSGTPTKYAFQWDRCDPVGDRRGCAPISGASSAKYAVKKDDVNHTLRVRVTATNASGSTTKDSKGTGVVSDANKPSSQSRPKIAGSANVGSTLTADTGTWAGATSFSYEWQSCDAAGNACTPVGGATGKTYGVRSSDAGHTLRVRVTAQNKYGTASATSDRTDLVKTGGAGTTSCSNGSGAVSASSIDLPQRLLIDRWSFTPSVITPATTSFQARIHVSLANGCSVAGAHLWATAVPYNQTNIVEATTGADGWQTLTFAVDRGFPANPGRQQILAMLVRSTKPGGSVLAGVSTRRVIAQRVHLR
jgi:hypothetical protein